MSFRAKHSEAARVLFVDHSAQLGGAEIGLVSLAGSSMVNGQVLLLEQGPLLDRLAQNRVPTTVLKLSLRNGEPWRGRKKTSRALEVLRSIPALRSAIVSLWRKEPGIVVVTNTLRSTILVACCKLPRKITVICMLRDGLARPYFGRLELEVAKCAFNLAGHAVIANSHWTAQNLNTRRRIQRHVLPPSIAPAFFETPLRDLPHGAKARVLVLGRIAEWKGQLLALEAANKVRVGREWELIFAGGAWFGEEAYLARLEERASTSAVDVHVLGHVDDVLSLIDSCDIVVHTSILPEPFGQVIVQGMARKRCVLVPDVGGPTEIVAPWKNGLTYSVGNSDDLAEKLKCLLTDADLREALAEEARATSLHYESESVAGKFAEIVRRVKLSPGFQ